MSLWEPASTLVFELSNETSLDELHKHIRECIRLAKLLDCPCASDFIIASALLKIVHDRFEGIAISEMQYSLMNDVTSYISKKIEESCNLGQPQNWRGLFDLWNYCIFENGPVSH